MGHTFGGRHRVIPALRKVSLLVSIGGLFLGLSAAPGCGKGWTGTGQDAARAENTAGTGSAGVPVTKEVPHSKETIPEIKDREKTNPLPARGDTAIHSHKIPRAGNDNCGGTE
jgi:hypothetical protein